MAEASTSTQAEPRPRVLLAGAVLAACLILVAFSIIERPEVVRDNLRWVWDESVDALQDDLFIAVLAPLLVLFGVIALRRSGAGQLMPWKDVGITALVGPATLLVGALIVGDGSPLGLVVFLVPIAQLVWSIVRVIRRPDLRVPLIAALLVGLWITWGLLGVAMGLYTGLGRTWR